MFQSAGFQEVVQGFSEDAWDNIEEEEPDEIDLEMIRDIETDPECRIFM